MEATNLIASLNFFTKIALIASPRAYPSAFASNDFEVPVGDITPCSVMAIVIVGVMRRLVPPTIADSQSPFRIAAHAVCIAIRLEEHAVLIIMLSCRLVELVSSGINSKTVGLLALDP